MIVLLPYQPLFSNLPPVACIHTRLDQLYISSASNEIDISETSEERIYRFETMGNGSDEHCAFVLLAEFDIDRGAQLTYQFPQPLGTDER